MVCLLKCWKDLDPVNLKEKKKQILIFLCTEAWPPYPLGDQEKWPSEGSLNYNTILQLDLFCKREEKWTEVTYIQLFFYLWDHPEWLHNCYVDAQTLAILCKPQDKHGERGPEKPLTSDRAPVPTAPPSALPSKPPQYSEPPMGASPFNHSGRRRASLCPLPVIRSKGDLKRSG
jgi:hypothetical protein